MPIKKRIRIARTQHNEWRVNIVKGQEETAYYTPDLDDAIYTAYAEWGQNIEITGVPQVTKEVARIQKEREAHNATK